MNQEGILNSYIHKKILICKYYWNIEKISIQEKNNCKSVLYMNINRKNWDYPDWFLYSKNYTVSQPLYKNTSECRWVDTTYFRYKFENLPISWSENIFDTYIDENWEDQQWVEILNTDIWLKYRFNSEIIWNNSYQFLESTEIPICKWNIFQEYFIESMLLVWFIIFSYCLFQVYKKYFKKW